MSANRWPPGAAWLLLPFALSLAPWFSTVAFLRVAESQVEGAMLVTASIGAVSFLLTAPLAGIVLAMVARKSPIGFRKFAVWFFLVSAPALGFQVFGFGMTVLPAVLYTGGSLAPDAPPTLFFSAAVAIGWYSVFALLFRSANVNIRKMTVASSLLVVITFVFFATRLIR